MLVMLQSGVRCNALRIAEEAGVHRRTVFRDFAALRSLGFPIGYDATTGCYHLSRGAPQAAKENAIGFSRLLELCRDDERIESATDLSSPPRQASGGDASLMSVDQRAWLDLIDNEAMFPEILASLVESIVNKRFVTIALSSDLRGHSEVSFIPTELTFKIDAWQVHGLDESGAVVTYDVKAILAVLGSKVSEVVSHSRRDSF
jgi:hypothetical protein